MKLITLSCLTALALSSSPQVGANGDGAVYTMDNSPSGNHILIYERQPDGTLVPSGSEASGGLGNGGGLGSQGAIVLTKDGQWLLAANAGSDEISVFAVTPKGLQLSGKVDLGPRLSVCPQRRGRSRGGG